MTFAFHKNSDFITIITSAICGIFLYLVLSYLLVLPRITVPVSLIMSTLILGLTKYYSSPIHYKVDAQVARSNEGERHDRFRNVDKGNVSQNIIIFVVIYAFLIAISTVISEPDSQIYISWNQIELPDITQLGAAIMLSFFMPGYAMILIIGKSCKINPMLKVLIAYLVSMLITGGIGYVLGLYLDIPVSESKFLVISIHIVILVALIISFPVSEIKLKLKSQNGYPILKQFLASRTAKLLYWAKTKTSELLVFGSLFMLLIIYSNYLFGGITIGDQWFHQGRALLFMSGTIREAGLSYADSAYAPFQSALLATFATLSGIPLVNAYASIAFLNIMPVFAFYYFFTRWMPLNMQRAKILACTLFATSSGFGWIYFLGLTVTTHPIVSQKSALDVIVSTEPFDIFQPTNFFLASHPDFSTGLIYIAIPAGFVLLGLLRGNFTNNFIFTSIVTSVSLLGILSHDEFYLFIIVASILPLVFKIKQANYLYLGIFFAFLIVYTMDVINPEMYYTYNEIFGLSLLKLSVLFTAFTWALHFMQQYLRGHHKRISIFFDKIRSRWIRYNSLHDARLHFLIGVLIISAVSYMYGLSFIVLAHLSTNDVIQQTAGYGGPYNIPWYLYSMKLGITGLLGLACVLSYLFKRFEREVFVFGIIIVIALLAGPYYDEHRFSKYIMAGMAGFASLLIYNILNSLRSDNKQAVRSIVIGVIITTASLSSIMYIGFNSLILQTQDFIHTLSRRNFPTPSEMSMFQTLYDKMDDGSKRYNILTFPNEYNDLDKGLVTKLQAFSGLPDTLLYHNPLTLNVSSVDAFFHLIDDSGTRFIIIPKDSINETPGLTEPVRFALEHFQHTYEDNKYVVLDVPDLMSPSTASEGYTGLIYNHNQKGETLLSNITDAKLLQYDNSTFNFGGETNFVVFQKGNKTEKAILSDIDSNKGLTFWSRGIDPSSGINYVEAGFRILAENGNRSNDVGLKWKEGLGDKEYYLSLSKNGLELYQKSSSNEDDNKILYQNVQIEKKNLVSYNLKLVILQNSTNVFLNDMLRIQMPRIDSWDSVQGISNVGISSYRNIVEFGPIKIGNVSEQNYDVGTNYNDFYYPFNILALSKSGYDIFMDRDLSALSKKQVILTFDPLEWDDAIFNKYLEYVNKGGTVVVMNSNDFKGRFSQIFPLQSNDNETESFTTIRGHDDQSISISGRVKRVDMTPSPNVTVISTYSDKTNKTVAPFAIEKDFSNGGRILLVNSEAYFNALNKSSRQYFLSLSNIPTLLDLDRPKAVASETSTEQAKRFVGAIKISGNVTTKSSSLLMPDYVDNLHDIHVDRIVIYNENYKLNRIINNVTIKDLKLIGAYEVTINSTGTSNLPNKDSEHQYISISMPSKFNITINPSHDKPSSAEIVTINGSSISTIRTDNASKIAFYKVNDAPLQKSTLILLKSPEVTVNGKIGFKESNFDPYFFYNDIPLDTEGSMKAQINFVDNYQQPLDNGTTKMQYITFLQSLSLNKTRDNDDGMKLELPGDISTFSKNDGPPIPLRDALFSNSSIILLVSIGMAIIIGNWVIWPKIKFLLEKKDV